MSLYVNIMSSDEVGFIYITFSKLLLRTSYGCSISLKSPCSQGKQRISQVRFLVPAIYIQY